MRSSRALGRARTGSLMKFARPSSGQFVFIPVAAAEHCQDERLIFHFLFHPHQTYSIIPRQSFAKIKPIRVTLSVDSFLPNSRRAPTSALAANDYLEKIMDMSINTCANSSVVFVSLTSRGSLRELGCPEWVSAMLFCRIFTLKWPGKHVAGVTLLKSRIFRKALQHGSDRASFQNDLVSWLYSFNLTGPKLCHIDPYVT